MTVIFCVITKRNFHIMLKISAGVLNLQQQSLDTVQLDIQGDILITCLFVHFAFLAEREGVLLTEVTVQLSNI